MEKKTIMLSGFDKKDEDYIFSLIKRELKEMGICPTSAAFHSLPLEGSPLDWIGITKEPSFLCTWNGGGEVEIHTLESLKDSFGGTGIFDTDNKYNEYHKNIEWSSNHRFHKDCKNFTEVLNYLTSDDLVSCHITYRCDDMAIQRIK
tara:strand:- start:384 stop:824 length:441 start_codon:yes stop_codon:yes gene_type:complete